jgi:hypothetical protein
MKTFDTTPTFEWLDAYRELTGSTATDFATIHRFVLEHPMLAAEVGRLAAQRSRCGGCGS